MGNVAFPWALTVSQATLRNPPTSLGGGGFATTGLTKYVCAASFFPVRGWEDFEQVLSIGLFDGIGALLGHISVESNEHAQRVVEALSEGTRGGGWPPRFLPTSLVVLGGRAPVPESLCCWQS